MFGFFTSNAAKQVAKTTGIITGSYLAVGAAGAGVGMLGGAINATAESFIEVGKVLTKHEHDPYLEKMRHVSKTVDKVWKDNLSAGFFGGGFLVTYPALEMYSYFKNKKTMKYDKKQAEPEAPGFSI